MASRRWRSALLYCAMISRFSSPKIGSKVGLSRSDSAAKALSLATAYLCSVLKGRLLSSSLSPPCAQVKAICSSKATVGAQQLTCRIACHPERSMTCTQ